MPIIKTKSGGYKYGPTGKVYKSKAKAVKQGITEIIKRISLYNSKVPCAENIYALEYLNSALGYLEARTEDREKRGVEGTYEV